jgi:hypothetical protein
MSNKTISINPSLFSVGSSKTKKNREKKTKVTVAPIISPNVLKNKLLKRIKEHKQRETQNLDNNKRKLEPKIDDLKSSNNLKNELLNFNDEFNDSINYLQTLSKQKRVDDEKIKYENLKQKRREEIEKRTIRNYHLGGSDIKNPIINIDLPDELQEPVIQQSIVSEPYKINSPYKGDFVPYGVLKGGLKPSYREWAKTQRSNIVTNPNSSLIIEGGSINSQQTARENRLNILKEKIKQKNQSKSGIMMTENLIKPPVVTHVPLETSLKNPIETDNISTISINTENIQPSPIIKPQEDNLLRNDLQNNLSEQNNNNEKIIATRHITKKTIKRKYFLGRSEIKQTVGILIKDRGTRKKILTAQKDLKKKNINDIKAYLKEHNLIKIGSNAPNDVIRKLYESAMLAGEITNNNSDTLFHNFTKEDKQL